MAPQRFQVTLDGHGQANCYEGERVLVALERAQGFGQLKNLPRRLPARRLWDLPGAGARGGILFRPDEPLSCFRGG